MPVTQADLENRCDVSTAWMLWSGAEAALADANCFAGGTIPGWGLVRVRGVARFRIVRLGGPKVRKARGNAADPLDGGDVCYVLGLLFCSSFGHEAPVKGCYGCVGWYAQEWYFLDPVFGAYCPVGLYSQGWSGSPCLP